MEVVQYQSITDLIPVVLVSLFWCSLVTLGVFWNLIKQGPKRFFGKKNRNRRPDVLDDPAYGTHHYARMKNIRLHYVAKGPKDRPLVLFLHGFPEFWYSWRHQLVEFGKKYRAVAVDMRGYSESERPEGLTQYHKSKLVRDVKDFIDHLGYKKCTLVTHDWGGLVGWTFAAKYPDYVEKFIACNAPNPLVLRDHMRTSWRQFRMLWYIFYLQMPWLPEVTLRSGDLEVLDAVFKSLMVSKKANFTQEDLEAYKYTFQHYGDLQGPINYYRAAMRFMPERLTNEKVQAPTMIIWGCRDPVLDKATVEPSGKYVNNEFTIRYIEDASHWVQQEDPEMVNKYIREFLQ